jgi:hypothetical protein
VQVKSTRNSLNNEELKDDNGKKQGKKISEGKHHFKFDKAKLPEQIFDDRKANLTLTTFCKSEIIQRLQSN